MYICCILILFLSVQILPTLTLDQILFLLFYIKFDIVNSLPFKYLYKILLSKIVKYKDKIHRDTQFIQIYGLLVSNLYQLPVSGCSLLL